MVVYMNYTACKQPDVTMAGLWGYAQGIAKSATYRSPSPATHEVICHGLFERPAGAAQQAQCSSVYKEVAVNACFLQTLRGELQHSTG